jgi:hypothetical protein
MCDKDGTVIYLMKDGWPSPEGTQMPDLEIGRVFILMIGRRCWTLTGGPWNAEKHFQRSIAFAVAMESTAGCSMSRPQE